MKRLLSALLLLVPTPSWAATLHVPSEYATIQAAVDAAVAGDTVLVAPGEYTECDGGDCLAAVVTLKAGVDVRSEGGAAVTTLRLLGALPEVVNARGLGLPGAEVSGFTVAANVRSGNTGINALEASSIVVSHSIFEGVGTAVGMHTNLGVELVVRDCIIRDCGVGGVAGVHTSGVEATVERCHFESSDATWLVRFDGEGQSSLTVKDCEFRDNVNGVAMVTATNMITAIVEDCSFVNSGGGVFMNVSFPWSLGIVRQSIFAGNNAMSGGFKWAAGGSNGLGTFEFRDNIAVGNTGYRDGAVLEFVARTNIMENNVVAYTGTDDGDVVVDVSPQVETMTSSCNLFWGNEGPDFNGFVPDPSDRFVDPEFCDWEGGDLTVMGTSPCLAPNSLGCGAIGNVVEGCGSVAVTEASWARIKAMFQEQGPRN